jgi:hypothetical protein
MEKNELTDLNPEEQNAPRADEMNQEVLNSTTNQETEINAVEEIVSNNQETTVEAHEEINTEEHAHDDHELSKLEMHEAIQNAEAESEDAEEISEEEADDEPEVDYSSLSKEELLAKLEEAVSRDDISKVKNRISAIKVEFLRIDKAEKEEALAAYLAAGGVREDYKPLTDPFEERFKHAFDVYKTKKVKFTEQLEKQKAENLLAKQQVLEELKVLVNSEETLKKTYDEFKALQERWKQIGLVPRTEINNLWQTYNFLVERFFDKVKINKELKDLDLRKNLELKIQLCEKAEELLLSPSVHKSFKLLQKYHDEWKETGPVPQDKKDEIWERFKTVTDRINAMRKEYYNSLQEEQENNLLAKTALCEKMEALLAAEMPAMQVWKEKTNEVTEMMKLWQAIGRAPAKQNDEVWQRFKKSINQFYNLKKEFFGGLKEQQLNNYNLKVNLCVQAEALKSNNNWKATTNEFLKLQQEWKKIGPVPRKYSDKIWKRFRAACDEFFNAKSNYYSNINQTEAENLKKKQDLIKQVDEFPVGEDKKANLDALRNFQRLWMEIGHVPMDQKEKMQNEFRNAINRLLDRLKISSAEANALQYKNKLDAIQSSPDSGKIMYRERNLIDSKINKLQSDINLWENNIGFLASSKNADILKEEFERKIKSAKEEVQLLKAKIKLLARQ